MDTKDITKEQMGTLVLIHSLEGYVADKANKTDTLAEAVSKLDESLSMTDGEQFISDIESLTEKGYLISDAGDIEGDIDEDIVIEGGYRVPTVECITPKGKSALDEWEQEFKAGRAGLNGYSSVFSDTTVTNMIDNSKNIIINNNITTIRNSADNKFNIIKLLTDIVSALIKKKH